MSGGVKSVWGGGIVGDLSIFPSICSPYFSKKKRIEEKPLNLSQRNIYRLQRSSQKSLTIFGKTFKGVFSRIVNDFFMCLLCEVVECHAKRYLLPLIVIEAGTQNWRIIFLSHIQFFNSKYRW